MDATVLFQLPLPVVVIVVAALVVITAIVAYQYLKMIKLEGVRKDAYQLILIAEKKFAHGENKKKLKYVIHYTRKLLPLWLQFFLTDAFLEKTIDTWFRGVKDLLDDGKVNGSVGKE